MTGGRGRLLWPLRFPPPPLSTCNDIKHMYIFIVLISFLVNEGTTQSPPDIASQPDDPHLSVSTQSESGKK